MNAQANPQTQYGGYAGGDISPNRAPFRVDLNNMEIAGRKMLGDLQAPIMDAIWASWETSGNGSTIRDVIAALEESQTMDRAYTTIATVIGRLVEYGFLKKHDGGPSAPNYYTPRITRQEYGRTVVPAVMEQLRKTNPREVDFYLDNSAPPTTLPTLVQAASGTSGKPQND